MIDPQMEERIRSWVEAQRIHPGRRRDRETSWTWLEALVSEIDRLRELTKP